MAKLLQYHEGVRLARRVIGRAQKYMPEGAGDHFWVDNYMNGREQGLRIRGWPIQGQDHWIVVCNNRNSDEIVVYHSHLPVQGHSGDGDHKRREYGVPTPEGWEDRQHFSDTPRGVDQAVAHIVVIIEDLLKLVD